MLTGVAILYLRSKRFHVIGFHISFNSYSSAYRQFVAFHLTNIGKPNKKQENMAEVEVNVKRKCDDIKV